MNEMEVINIFFGGMNLVKYIFASHGTLAKGILSSIELIIGKQSNIYTICGYIDENFDLSAEIDNYFSKISRDDIVIVITDILGGSINNEFLSQLKCREFHLIAGLNLSLVLELIVSLNEGINLELQINNAIEKSKVNIKYCNQFLNKEIKDVTTSF